ncbi:MAG: dTMP kinase [Aestuariivita sp.]|nr:dTMP kinase [Aestuariivita sp.]MCY4201888.1 dTMP kinase [Aestuariivita sp.]
MFISMEGIDGAGKSTQVTLLKQELVNGGHRVVDSREPGGTEGAERIRSLLLEGESDRWSAETEILLFTAARNDHYERVIQPALQQGAIVICDRFADSTRVYQSRGKDDLKKRIDSLHSLFIGREPDLTVLIDIDPSLGWYRALARQNDETRFEKIGLDLQVKLRAEFLNLANKEPDRFEVVDGNRDTITIARDVYDHVFRKLMDWRQKEAYPTQSHCLS